MAKAPSPAASAEPVAKKAAPRAKAAPKTVKPAKIEAEADGATFKDQAGNFAKNAGDKARDYANVGKDKASDALSGLSGMVDDLAKTVDEKFGAQYGDYARKAAGTVSGVADALKDKNVDDLVEDTRKFIREKPAVAIGAAAAVGFVLMRLMKAGSNDKGA